MRKLVFAFLSVAVVAGSAAIARGEQEKQKPKMPNILWITCEDIGPHLGCYGDKYSTTPNLDRLARRSLLYLHCWSNAPVCAPARTAIITGMYPPSTGSQHMRSLTRLPPNIHMYVVLLRRLGYYCTNNVKQDYNLVAPRGMWNESSRKAHYKNRPKGRPFFAVFNITVSHESRIRIRPHKFVHDPKKVRIPAYHPDTPEVRKDWAQYYDKITEMDARVGQLLRELEELGLAEDTIVFFYSDHGSGMPRNKRHASNSGLHVPLIIHVPEKWRHLAPKDYQPGGRTERLVSFVDLAPTLLSLAGQRPMPYHQGRAFMGKYEAPPRTHLFGFRGRMDERYDMVRSVRNKRYVYLRNYWPHKPHGQHVQYQFRTPTTRVWKELFDLGKLNKVQAAFWQRRQPEELYDLQSDPDEVINLAHSDRPEHRAALAELREQLRKHIFRIRDLGFLPENEIHTRSVGSTPYEIGHDPSKYPLKRIYAMAEAASSLKSGVEAQLAEGLRDSDSAVRYWAALGLVMRGKEAVARHRRALHAALKDPAPAVRIAACEALGTLGNEEDVAATLPVLAELADPRKNTEVHQVVMALNVLDIMGDKAAPLLPQIRQWPAKMQNSNDPRANIGVERLIPKIRRQLSAKGK